MCYLVSVPLGLGDAAQVGEADPVACKNGVMLDFVVDVEGSVMRDVGCAQMVGKLSAGNNSAFDIQHKRVADVISVALNW